MKPQISGAFYKSLFDNANDGILLADLKTQKFYLANKAICKMLGYGQEELLSLGVPDIHPQEDLPYVMEQFEKQSRGKMGENILAEDMPMKRKDGSVFYTDISASRVKMAGRIYLMGIFRDITGQRQTEKDLGNAKIAAQNVLEDLSAEKSKMEMEKAKEEAILMSIGDGLIATDEKGNIIIINKSAEKLLGIKGKEVMGKAYYEILPIENEQGVSVPADKRPMGMALAAGTTTTTTTTTTTGFTFYYVRKDKTRFPVAIMVTPVIFGGKVIGAIDVFRDITREREIDKMKSEFVAVASHQLRAPLTGIKWFSELLLKIKLDAKAKEYAEQIVISNERMVRLVDDLLNVSRIETGRNFDVILKNTDIVPLIKNVLKEQAPSAEQKHIALICLPNAPTELILPLDELKMRQVFQNLVSNAIKYSKEKTEIMLGCEQKKGEAVFFIKDQGVGIPKHQQNQIFSKFFRAENVATMHTDGTGLGLYIVKAIVEAHHGKVWFESVENKGTTFYVSLPMKLIK